MGDGGTYALVTILGVECRLQVGKLGIHSLVPGYYVYVGSALGGLSGRLGHHLRSEKKLHWHIDYLLREVEVVQIWYAFGQLKLECTWNAIVGDLPGAMSSTPGFGASDCRCSSHLTYFPAMPSLSLFQAEVRQNGLLRAYQLDLTI